MIYLPEFINMIIHLDPLTMCVVRHMRLLGELQQLNRQVKATFLEIISNVMLANIMSPKNRECHVRCLLLQCSIVPGDTFLPFPPMCFC